MQKRIAKKLIICIILVAFTALIVFLAIFIKLRYFTRSSSTFTEREAIYKNWGIELPVEKEIEYFLTSKDLFRGEGIRYHIYLQKEEPTEFLTDFEKTKNLKTEKAVNNILDALLLEAEVEEIPVKYLPDWNCQYYWDYKGKNWIGNNYADDMYMLYFPDSLRLIVCQSII